MLGRSDSQVLLAWCDTFRAPRLWVSGTVSYLGNIVTTKLEKALEVHHKLAAANLAKSN